MCFVLTRIKSDAKSMKLYQIILREMLMDKRKIENLRVKKSIASALLDLLEEKSISEISVSEIIAKAGVARASFYRNFATKENVIITMISDVLEEYRATLVKNGQDYCNYENIRTCFEFFSRYQKQVLDLHRFGYGSLILDMLNQFHEEVAGTMPFAAIERYKLYIYIGSLYNTAMTWLRNGKKEGVDEITHLFYQCCAMQ